MINKNTVFILTPSISKKGLPEILLDQVDRLIHISPDMGLF